MAEDKSVRQNNRIRDALIRWGVFLGIAIAALLFVLLPFMIRGNYLAWSGNGSYSDGIVQHATFLEYMFRHGLFGGAGGYDYNIGLGADYMVSFSYYMMFDPVNLLLYILPRGNFLLSYSIVACARMLLCAVFMFVYLGRHGIKQSLRVIFSVAYMLAGYVVFTFTRHPDLTAGAIYLPLVTLGLERTLDKNNPFLLIVCVFLTTVSSFYMAYMVTVYAVLYAALYYVRGVHLRGEKVTGKKFCAAFFRTAAYYALGLLLASFLLVPVAYGYLKGARSAGKGFPVYTPRELAAMCGSFFVPVSGAKYTPVMFNAATLLLAFAAISASPRSVYAKMSVILSVCVFVPLAGYVMNLFNYAFNRYIYMLSFSVFALLADFLNGLPIAQEGKCGKLGLPDAIPQKRQANAMVKGIFTAIFVMGNLGAWAGIDFLSERAHAAVIAVLVTVAIGLVCLSVWGLRKIYSYDFSGSERIELLSYKRVLICFAALTLAGALCFNIVYSGQFRNKERYAALQSVAESTVAALPDDEFVRLDTQMSTYADASNRPLNNGYRGTSVYNTLFSGSASAFVSANELYTFSTSLGMSGLNGRSALSALLGVKYFRAQEGAYVPMQFTPTDVPELYETDDYIRFGTVFSQTMSRAQWDALPAVERQYALLQAVITEDGEELPYAALAAESDTAESFTLKGKRDVFEFTAPTATDAAVYLSFEIEDFPSRETFFRVTSGAVLLEMDTSPKGGQMYTGQKKFLYKLDESADKVKFEIVSGAAVSFCNLRFYAVQNAAVREWIGAAKSQAHLTDTRFTDKGFSGKIASRGGTMLIPLPYAEGWSATVDGESVKIREADGGLMCIAVPEGTHAVEFAYRTPWLSAGVLLSVAAAGIFVVFTGTWCAVRLVRRQKARKEKESDGQNG